MYDPQRILKTKSNAPPKPKHQGIYLIRPAGKMWYETNLRVEVARYKMDAPMTVDH